MNILVTGVTGYIGRQLVPRLTTAGHHVVCMARDPQRLIGSWWDKVEIRQGDVLDLASLSPVMQGIEVAYYLIHSMAGGKRGFIQRDEVAAHNFGIVAREAGVRRIIYLGGLGQCEKNISPHLDSRQHVGDELRRSGVPV